MALKSTTDPWRAGQQVRNKFSGDIGTIVALPTSRRRPAYQTIRELGLQSDCVLVQWLRPSEPLLAKRTSLELLDKAALAVAEYNKRQEAHRATQAVVVENGHLIRTVQSQFGKLYMVEGTRSAFATLPEAVAFARASK